MNFQEALGKLNIEDYGERIYNSNSHGELLHLADYIFLANLFEKDDDISWFRVWFEKVIDEAGKKWNRPESVFQHIPKLLKQSFEN